MNFCGFRLQLFAALLLAYVFSVHAQETTSPASAQAPSSSLPESHDETTTLPEGSPSGVSEEKPDEPERILSLRGVNLATATWFAAADLPPDAAPEEIVARAVSTSPTATLRTSLPGGTGILFTFLDLEGNPPAGLSALITIGDIEGNDETFFNGERIGATFGWGVTENGRPRAYHIPSRLLRAGRNVLAVRLSGFGGRPSFRISREPITFAFIPMVPETCPGAPDKPAGAVTALAEKEARAAIAAADPSTSSASAPLLRKRPSFGRFGHFLHDGLPAVTEVTPTRIDMRQGPAFDVLLDGVSRVSLAAGRQEPGLDGWHKLTRVEGTISSRPVRYTALQHLLYPGTVYTLEEGPALRLSVRFPGRQGMVQPLTSAELGELVPGADRLPRRIEAFVLYEPKNESVPAVLVAEGAAANISQTDDGRMDITLARTDGNGKGAAPRIFIFYPTGLRRLDLSGRPDTFSAVAAVAEPELPTTFTLRRWMRIGLHVPEAVDEYFQVRPEANVVRIYQTVRYAPPPTGKEDFGGPFLFLPPQVEFARRALNYPANSMNTTETGVLAFSGPITAALPGPGRIKVAWYDLPLPPMEERGLLAVDGAFDLKEEINAHLTDLVSTGALTAVDSLYKSRVQGFQAFSYLTVENRRRLLEDSRRVAENVLRGEAFYSTTEPLSGLSFAWTHFIEGPSFDRFDHDWGNGLALTGLHYFVRYAGEWDLVTANWKGVERIFSWFTVSDDWEWMRASNGLHGHGTGAGDCMNATYAAAVAYAKLARGCGRTEEYHYGLYTAARAALLALNRFVYNDWADAHDLKQAASLVLGFHEGRGFLVGELEGYAWNATSMISANGVQPENFDLYLKYAADPLREYEKTFEQAFPNWADGWHRYPGLTLYQNNSGAITLPHIYLRARLRMDGLETLRKHLADARTNSYMWWLAPPVIAEVLNTKRDGAYVSDWGRCAFLGGELRPEDKDKKRMRIEARFDTRTGGTSSNAPPPSPETVTLVIPRGPSRVTINDGPVPLTDSHYEDGRLTLKLRRPGLNTVTVIY